MTEETTPEKASFNQAQYQQIRINELLLRIDRLGINPLMNNPEFYIPNYQIIFNDLTNVLLTISAKLTPTEKTEMLQERTTLNYLIITKPVTEKIRDGMGRTMVRNSSKNWNEINNALFNYRARIEELMDIHGFGNPTKDDPRKSVFKGV